MAWDLTPNALKPHSDEKLAKQLIKEAREPMRRAIHQWLELWWPNLPPNAVEQMKAIRDANEEP